MNRRALITAVGTAIFAGCISTGNQGTNNQGTKDDKLIINTEPVAPGQTGTITIRTTKTEYIINHGDLVDSPINVYYDNASFSSQPNVTEQSYPPNWRWYSARNLTVKIPYHVPPDTQPGKYTGSISVRRNFDAGSGVTEKFTITVTNDTT